MTYRAGYTAVIDGTEADFSVLAASVYVRDGDRWLGALYQQTQL